MSIDAPPKKEGGPPFFCSLNTPQTRSGHGIDALQRKTKGFSDFAECVGGSRAKMQKYLAIISNAEEMIENELIFICRGSDMVLS